MRDDTPAIHKTGTLPKKIWFLWHQGWESAPSVVKECYRSWEALNPEWDVVFLTDENLSEYILLDKYQRNNRILIQALSDIIRILLMHRHGGVWVDASIFCTRPLDEWIHFYVKNGFFSFSEKRDKKMISSWFLAASKNSYAVDIYAQKVESYWCSGCTAPPSIARFFHKVLLKTKIDSSLISVLYITKRLTGIYPYFWFHYLFEVCYNGNPQFARLWESTPKVFADGPHTLQSLGLYSPITDDLKSYIDDNFSMGVHKLQWQLQLPAPSGSILEYLIENNKKRYNYR
ncbi:MAG: capsular polysaccharide synthesis protein [Candidatus Thiodiazotropha sp. (ex Dulcina madagascariensis)]|nr:capsular polysaccharide synthesis protein [Candidatus Thiodiazotropha sp. (ex Dulcina madagascariensis)]